MIKITQGDNYAHDFTVIEYPDLSDWDGTWAIVSEIDPGGFTLASGTLTHGTDISKMQIRMAPDVSETLPIGPAYLIAEITSSDGLIRKEVVQDRVEIKPQGIDALNPLPPWPVQSAAGDYVTPQMFGAIGNGTTDDTTAMKAVAAYAKNKGIPVKLKGFYAINDTIYFDDVAVQGMDGYYSRFNVSGAITALQFTGQRKEIGNFDVWFIDYDTTPAPSTAIGILFGGSTYNDAKDQFSNNTIRQVYVRYASQSYKTNYQYNVPYASSTGDLATGEIVTWNGGADSGYVHFNGTMASPVRIMLIGNSTPPILADVHHVPPIAGTVILGSSSGQSITTADIDVVAITNTGEGTLWNNTFINCRSDFAVDYGWYFRATTGSTSQTWINCMCDGVPYSTGGTSKGWYINEVDDVAWLNCQADDLQDGKAIYCVLATNLSIDNFRIESSQLAQGASGSYGVSQFFYVNSFNATINNIKIASSTFSNYSNSVIRLGTKTNAIVGPIAFESCDIDDFLEANDTISNLYHVNSNGLNNGYKCVITSPVMQISSVFRDDTGTRTVFANKAQRQCNTAIDPVDGTYEVGDIINTNNVGSSAPKVSRVCTRAGTFGTIGTINATTTQYSRRIVVDTYGVLTPGDFISITGITFRESLSYGAQPRGRILLLKTEGAEKCLYMHELVDETVTAAVAYYAPIFTVNNSIVNKGITGSRPSLASTDYGIIYMDTTLDADGLPIMWNGTKWIKFDGTDA